MSTLRQRERAFTRAAKKLNEAADALSGVMDIALEFGVETDQEEYFAKELRERSRYLENCTWWKRR